MCSDFKTKTTFSVVFVFWCSDPGYSLLGNTPRVLRFEQTRSSSNKSGAHGFPNPSSTGNFRFPTPSLSSHLILASKNSTLLMRSFCLCSDPGSNWGPIPLQGSALPTELSERFGDYFIQEKERFRKTYLSTPLN